LTLRIWLKINSNFQFVPLKKILKDKSKITNHLVNDSSSLKVINFYHSN